MLVPLLAATLLYALGVRSAWHRAGIGRGVSVARAGCFAAGTVALFAALVWPLDALGERLFSAHMAQHLVLMNLAAPLCVLGTPLPVWLRALPARWQRVGAAAVQARPLRAGRRWLGGAAAATVLQLLALWAWHTPRGIDAALADDTVHIAMHASLLLAALLFWSAVWRPLLGHRSARVWVSLAALAVTLKVNGLVCITLMLQPGARYAGYGASAMAWGFAPAGDEQLGWGLMMVAGMASCSVAAIVLLLFALQRTPRSMVQS